MKNAIVATLSLALIFFMLHSFGAFDAGELVDRNYRGHFARERERHVAKSKNWLFGYTFVVGSDISEATVMGIHFAADQLNEKGGVLGRPVRLEGRATEREPQAQTRAVQHFCDNFSAAVYFGPAYTAGVPAVRALSQFQGLPLVSPLTLQDPLLPKLEPENYVPLLPHVSFWTNAIVAAVKKLDPKRVLVVAPGELASYGEFFANAFEHTARRELPRAEVYRYNYDVNIADSEGFRHIIDLYKENRGVDAVIYAGGRDTLPLLVEALTREGLKVPVFGSDMLFGTDENNAPIPDFPLYIPELTTKSMAGDFGRAWREQKGREANYWNHIGAMAVYLTCEAIKQEGGYDTDTLPQRIRELADRFWREEAPVVFLRLVGREPGKSGEDRPAGDGEGKSGASEDEPNRGDRPHAD